MDSITESSSDPGQLKSARWIQKNKAGQQKPPVRSVRCIFEKHMINESADGDVREVSASAPFGVRCFLPSLATDHPSARRTRAESCMLCKLSRRGFARCFAHTALSSAVEPRKYMGYYGITRHGPGSWEWLKYQIRRSVNHLYTVNHILLLEPLFTHTSWDCYPSILLLYQFLCVLWGSSAHSVNILHLGSSVWKHSLGLPAWRSIWWFHSPRNISAWFVLICPKTRPVHNQHPSGRWAQPLKNPTTRPPRTAAPRANLLRSKQGHGRSSGAEIVGSLQKNKIGDRTSKYPQNAGVQLSWHVMAYLKPGKTCKNC
jgi:hypothetical protein